MRTLVLAASWLVVCFLLRRPVTIRVAPYDFRLRLPPLFGHQGSTWIYVQREYYEPLLLGLGTFVRPGGVFIDGGANQGIFTCAAARLCGPEGRVVAIEPQSYARAALEQNIRLNGFRSVAIVPKALFDSEGTALLDRSASAVSASIVRRFGERETETVETTTLDRLVEELALPRVDVIKLDVEGAELPALRGAARTIAACRPILVLESLDPESDDWAAATALLAGQGYMMHLLDEAGRLQPCARLAAGHPNVVFLPSAETAGGATVAAPAVARA
ncbi:FkbM family methyltransferase [Tistlia consotensis]|uniref:FkbM family methyltransferase n=1 Tax=Tistlia consotensis TaxID=1321365 RepID=UPI00135658E4|nr:FkbM family methyltransferase [Tistlia consotensis]